MEMKFYAFKLSGLMIAIFIFQVLFSGFTDLFVLNSGSYAQPWRFLTAVFLHGGLAHLVYNLFALVLFGSILESLIGSRRFLLVFFVTGILANLISVNFYSSSLGASGAILGIIGALVFVRPMLTVWAFGLPMPIFVAGIFWVVGDLIGAYGFFTGNPINNKGNIAHLSGMFFGLLFGVAFRNSARGRKRRERRRGVNIGEGNFRKWEEAYLR
jgi:uncharacterized protein